MHQSRVQLRSGVEGSDFCEEWQRPEQKGFQQGLVRVLSSISKKALLSGLQQK